MDDPAIGPGDTVALCQDDQVHLVQVPEKGDTVKLKGLGVLSSDLFASARIGQTLSMGRRSARILAPTPNLVFQALSRKAQVITPQDAARIVYETGIGPGSTVIEGGLGSGALSSYLAHIVGQDGIVHGYEVREDHLNVARGNLERAGLAGRVEFHHAGLQEATQTCDAFLVDVPSPTDVLEAATACLVPGGRICFYTPIVEQMGSVVHALREGPYRRVRSFEQLERGWVVHDGGARPSFQMLGHTGFLTVGTRIEG